MEEEVIAKDCSSFVGEEALSTMVVTQAMREGEEEERRDIQSQKHRK